MKMDKISEGMVGVEDGAGGRQLLLEGIRHCLGSGDVQEAAAREEGGMPEFHCFS